MMNIDFTALTEDELKTLYRNIDDEQARRYRMKRAKLIENFKLAFYALKDAGIDISYDFEDDGEITQGLTHWDNFYFD